MVKSNRQSFHAGRLSRAPHYADKVTILSHSLTTPRGLTSSPPSIFSSSVALTRCASTRHVANTIKWTSLSRVVLIYLCLVNVDISTLALRMA
ncbi:hypothetical protein PoB_002564000 [Plakobranchus ocellatus]|uniref:Uncharacterized protein n=1 Tax=Plakobranchus ocellatus TaxID=259542 RepID=A0AAV3ZVC5_9GAST|nr:hypothetical protein PoB_002564000 [Plakobranchus ocellatus]